MEIRDCALYHLRHRNRTESEMRRHLANKGFTDEEIGAEVTFLTEFSYIDDADYCNQYIEYAFSKGRGIGRIKVELMNKGIRTSLIDGAIEQFADRLISEEGMSLKEVETEKALFQAEKMVLGMKEADSKGLAKVARKLSTLGYDSEVIYSVLGRIMNGRG